MIPWITSLLWPLVFTVCFFFHTGAGQNHPCDGITGDYDSWYNQAINDYTVVIVGGGIAGLEAAKTLLENNIENILLLEAQDYLGGRVRTYRNGDVLLEDGAEWIHGGKRNILYRLAQDLGGLTEPLPDSAYDWRIRTQDGAKGDDKGYEAVERVYGICERNRVLAKYKDDGYGQCYIDRFPKAYKKKGAKASEEEAWFHYFNKLVVSSTGHFDWNEQSGRDAYRFTDLGSDHHWADGYDTLTEYIKRSIPDDRILTSKPVCKIFWKSNTNSKVVVVTSEGDAYTADYVLVTASIGHLKERHLSLFDPKLPESYRKNFENIELGTANKIHIGWDSSWWGSNKPLDLNVIFTDFNLPAEEDWLYGIMGYTSVHQQENILQGFVVGENALKMEALSDAEVKDHLVRFLETASGTTVPTPTFFRRTKWNGNMWTRGSYGSYITVEGYENGLKSRKPLQKPIKNGFKKKVIFWAGEHTHNTRYSTADGAVLSGRKMAEKIVKYNKKRN